MNPIIFNADYLFNPDLMDFDIPIEIHVTRFLKNDYPLIVQYSVAKLGLIKFVLSQSKPKLY